MNELQCSKCYKTFSTKGNRLKHERVSDVCGGNIPKNNPVKRKLDIDSDTVKKRRWGILQQVDDLAINNGGSECRSETFAKMNDLLNGDEVMVVRKEEEEEGSPQCKHCRRGFISPSMKKRHECLFLPSSEPGQVKLRQLQGDTLRQFLLDTNHNSDRQRMSLCSTLGLAVPGVWPLLFLK